MINISLVCGLGVHCGKTITLKSSIHVRMHVKFMMLPGSRQVDYSRVWLKKQTHLSRNVGEIYYTSVWNRMSLSPVGNRPEEMCVCKFFFYFVWGGLDFDGAPTAALHKWCVRQVCFNEEMTYMKTIELLFSDDRGT